MHLSFRKARSPDEVGHVKIPYDRTKRGAHRLAWFVIVGLALSPFLYLAIHAVSNSLMRTANGTVTLPQLEVRASEAGMVRQLNVAVGDDVAAGATLVVLDSTELDAADVRNAATYRTERAELRQSARERGSLQRELALQERGVQYQRDRSATVADLFQRGAATRAELDEATARLTEAECALLRIRRGLVALGNVPDSGTVERTTLSGRRGALTALAPFPGRAISVSVQRGQFVATGETMLVLADTSKPRITAYVPAKFATRLAIGVPAVVYFPDGTRIHAAISATAKVTARTPPDLVDQFGLRPMTVVLELMPDAQWPKSQIVQGLPVIVRFHYAWESYRVGSWLADALGWFTR
jgi:multidrug resistance efflux pump